MISCPDGVKACVRRIRAVYAERDRTKKSNSGYPGRERLLRQRNEVLGRGCGTGSLLGWFHEQGVPAGHLFGVDLLPNRIRSARETYPKFTFIEGNAEQLAFPNNAFDLALVFTVFSSILDLAMATSIARDIIRILSPRGLVVWYDIRYPNPWNSAVRAMTKPRIRGLFPSFDLELEGLSLLPPLAYRLGQVTDWTYPLLHSVPILRSHYLGLLRQPRDSLRARSNARNVGTEEGSNHGG